MFFVISHLVFFTCTCCCPEFLANTSCWVFLGFIIHSMFAAVLVLIGYALFFVKRNCYIVACSCVFVSVREHWTRFWKLDESFRICLGLAKLCFVCVMVLEVRWNFGTWFFLLPVCSSFVSIKLLFLLCSTSLTF